jgi:hypothetical protein
VSNLHGSSNNPAAFIQLYTTYRGTVHCSMRNGQCRAAAAAATWQLLSGWEVY